MKFNAPLLEGVFLVPVQGANAYLLQAKDGSLVVIDTGLRESKRGKATLWEFVQQLGHRPTDVRAIFVTHADLDHVGNVVSWQQASGAVVYLGRKSAEHLVQGTFPSHNNRLVDVLVRHFVSAPTLPTGVMRIVEDGETVPIDGGITAIAAPGHTSDLFAFYHLGRRLLFAGDALVERQKGVSATHDFISADPALARQSADKLLRLPAKLLAVGHGKPVIKE